MIDRWPIKLGPMVYVATELVSQAWVAEGLTDSPSTQFDFENCKSIAESIYINS